MTFREAAGRHDSLLRELNGERAAALARVARTFESILERLADARSRLPASGDARREALAQYAELRQRALQYRWYLEVQREAIGIRRHQMLDEFYRIPPAIDH